MKKEFNQEEYERLKKVKEDFDNRLIEEKDISEEDTYFISSMYDYQIKNIMEEIKELQGCIEDYKKRMKDAIEYLDSKKVND